MAISAGEKTKVWLWAHSWSRTFYSSFLHNGENKRALCSSDKTESGPFCFHHPHHTGRHCCICSFHHRRSPYHLPTVRMKKPAGRQNGTPIQDVKPDTEHTLKITVSSKPGEEEGQWGAGVLINSYDEAGNSVRILNEYIEEEMTEEPREITFTTRPDTVRLNIGFSNRFPNTEATFYTAELYKKPMIYPRHSA